ncbi:MAG: homoserine O-succinyltransferase [Lachnospiraceae bacterium]|nr:homoserine O-succinyltransferase [Lachnospiraceae bacterium]
MPIKVKNNLPVKQILEDENVFVMDESRAEHQDIRPVDIAIMNLMPLKEDTELALLRTLSNTVLQVNVTLLSPESHDSTHVPESHIKTFYESFREVKQRCFDGLILTGAPVEQMEYEEVDYWEEIVALLDWADSHVTSMLTLCWGAQAALYHYYGIGKKNLPEKVFGVYPHRVIHRKTPLVRGFDDVFLAPHSRHTGIDELALRQRKDILILAESAEAGTYLCMNKDGSRIFCLGHPEYDRFTLDAEYRRDKDKGLAIKKPVNYYPEEDVEQEPKLQWRGHANALYSNWLNYYVYQNTPYEFNRIVWG